jgi:polyketide synthase PksN
MQEFYSNEEEAISCLGIPEELEESFGQYCIHPTLTDGGVQTVVNLAYNTIADKDTIYLPFAMGKLEILNPELRVCYAYVNRADDKNKTDAEAARYNVFYLSEHGEVALCISDFSIRPFHNMPKAKPEGDDESSVVYIQSNYERVDCPSNNKLNGDILILAEDEQLYTALKKEAERQNRCIALVKPGKCYKVSENMIYEIDPGVSDHYMYLIEDLHAKGLRLENIIHMWSESIEKWNRNTVNDWLERGLYTMFYLTKALLSKYAGNEMRFIYIYKFQL